MDIHPMQCIFQVIEQAFILFLLLNTVAQHLRQKKNHTVLYHIGVQGLVGNGHLNIPNAFQCPFVLVVGHNFQLHQRKKIGWSDFSLFRGKHPFEQIRFYPIGLGKGPNNKTGIPILYGGEYYGLCCDLHGLIKKQLPEAISITPPSNNSSCA